MQIDANDISDEMLYDQIAGNAGLRANITSYMRARGYVSDDDLQTATSGVGAGDGTGAAQRSLAQTGSHKYIKEPVGIGPESGPRQWAVAPGGERPAGNNNSLDEFRRRARILQRKEIAKR